MLVGKPETWPTVTCWTPWIAGLSPSMDGWPGPMGRDIALVQQVQWLACLWETIESRFIELKSEVNFDDRL